MGKDKFIQIMRAGIAYDRTSGKFAVRRLDNLEAVEERLTGILSKPVKFARQGQISSSTDNKAIQTCYVDGLPVVCEKCEFIPACSTYNIASLKFCLCDDTMVDPKAYEVYVAKNASNQDTAKPALKTTKPTKRASTRRKASGST
jgi:hypothetical protein